MGRMVEQTNPTEMDGDWNPAGDDATGWRWSYQTFDWQGRPRVTTNADGTTREVTYEGCGCAGSQIVTVRDEVNRRQRATYDSLGRLWKNEILNADWSVYRTVTNTYSPLDQLTRIKEAYTGTEAREFVNQQPPSGVTDGPYRQTYHYDPFSNLTGRDNRFWSQTDSFAASYTNHRRDGWQYDAMGNLTSDDQFNYKWDAAGRNREIGDPYAQRAQLQWHSGDNQVVKRAVWQSGVWTEVEYFVRSSALGGRVVTELNRYGQKQKGYVHLGGQIIAEQGAQTYAFAFRHDNPLTGSRKGSAPDGGYSVNL